MIRPKYSICCFLIKHLDRVDGRFDTMSTSTICSFSRYFWDVRMSGWDWTFLRYLWQSFEKEGDLDIYEFSRLLSGITVSPFLCSACPKHKHLRAAETGDNSTYVDDVLYFCDNEKVRGLKASQQTYSKTKSSSWKDGHQTKLLKPFRLQIDSQKKKKIKRGTLARRKTLNVLWKADNDSFQVKVYGPCKTLKTAS